jgi:hypothetical protein
MRQELRIIALYGPQTVGKTTVANRILEIGQIDGWRRLSFAEPIRAMLAAILPSQELSPLADKSKPLAVLGGKTSRDALKLLGTEWGRKLIDIDIWLNVLLNKATENNWNSIVIDDLRMDNEYAAIKRLGGLVVRVKRETDPPYDPTHESELQWPLWKPDFIATNNAPASCAQDILSHSVQFFNKKTK